ncbi:hypothetical protein Plhal304r1_c009g0034611 [Plasmopara halstedii]
MRSYHRSRDEELNSVSCCQNCRDNANKFFDIFPSQDARRSCLFLAMPPFRLWNVIARRF